MGSFGKNLALWIIIGLVLVALFQVFQGSSSRQTSTDLAFSQFLAEVEAGQVQDVTIQGNTITGHYTNGTAFNTYAPYDPELVKTLRAHDVQIAAVPVEEGGLSIVGILISWFPLLLFIGVWIFMMRQMQSGGGKAMGFGKSKAKLLTERHGRVTFEDVAGVDEAKEDLEEIVEFLKRPAEVPEAWAARIPKRRRCWSGLPAPARRCWPAPSPARPMCPSSRSRAPTSSRCSWVSAPAACATCSSRPRRTRPASSSSTRSTPWGRHRGAGLGGGNDEREQTLNQLLVEMDGFEANEGVILISATNRPDVLDPALLRPGRFDRQVVVPNPDVLGREKILKVHMRKVPLAPDVKPRTIARGTPGFSGRGHRQSGERGGAARGAARQARRHHDRVRGRQGQGHDGRRAALHGDDRRGEAAHRLHEAAMPWWRRTSMPPTRSTRPHHPARARARHGGAAAGGRPDFGQPREAGGRHHRRHGRAHRRGDDLRLREGDQRSVVRSQDGDPDRAQHGDPVWHVRRGRGR